MKILRVLGHCLLGVSCLILSSCPELWGPLNNPVDPQSESYQGFLTETDPDAVAPASNDAGVVTYIPTLVSSKVVGATAYQFKISETANFTTVVYTSPETESNEILVTDIPGLQPTVTYYWRVRVQKDGVWSAYSEETATFSLSAPATGNVTPVNTSITSDTTPLLDWSDVSGATGYEVRYANTSAEVTSATAYAVTISQYQVPSGLELGNWYWRVRAKNADNVWGVWSSTWSFTVAWIYSITPTTANGGTTNNSHPLLDWTDVNGANGYEIQYATTSDGLGILGFDTQTIISQYEVNPALDVGTWYWRVRAINLDNEWGAWSDTWSIKIEPLLTMILVPGGTFYNGTANVSVSSFYISKYEITQSQYATVTGNSPSSFSSVTDGPVENITWYDAVEFCNKLSELENMYTCYEITGRSPSSGYPITNATVNWADDFGYRLPTEAEWEFAARGGNNTHNYDYSGSSTLDTVGWYSVNAGNTTHNVGAKVANELELYDMSGNVWEWVWDWYNSYSTMEQSNPTGPGSGTYRVNRGGGWGSSSSNYCTVFYRGIVNPSDRGNGLGFRVVYAAY